MWPRTSFMNVMTCSRAPFKSSALLLLIVNKIQPHHSFIKINFCQSSFLSSGTVHSCGTSKPFLVKITRNGGRTRHRCTLQQCQTCHSAPCGCESVLSVQSYVTKLRQTLDKKPPKCMILFRPGTILTNPISIVSEYNESPKDVQSSLGAHTCRQHCAKKRNLVYWALNQFH